MRSLVIYDNNGRIYSISYGAKEEDVPVGLRYLWVVIPDGSVLRNIDVSDPDNPQPVFDVYLNVNLGDINRNLELIKEAADTTAKQMTFVKKAASFAAVSFTDAQAYEVADLYDDWGDYPVGYHFEPGLRVRFNGELYKVIGNGHDKQDEWTPVVAVSEFAKILNPNPDVIPEWEQPGPNNAYQFGDKVTHNGLTWESTFDGDNVWEPGIIGTESYWKEIN